MFFHLRPANNTFVTATDFAARTVVRAVVPKLFCCADHLKYFTITELEFDMPALD